ncbi:hypothetical protein P9239_21205 [Caballeronia sp. LZ062]|nr:MULTISPECIES: hypothetical protein [unclassified Caballeronia]MDR5856196.1 hypothetical protein [Caballeronia sp. LZ050]MDR5872867.1 hypothetical protein [Caballeronia sp. LZ062]
MVVVEQRAACFTAAGANFASEPMSVRAGGLQADRAVEIAQRAVDIALPRAHASPLSIRAGFFRCEPQRAAQIDDGAIQVAVRPAHDTQRDVRLDAAAPDLRRAAKVEQRAVQVAFRFTCAATAETTRQIVGMIAQRGVIVVQRRIDVALRQAYMRAFPKGERIKRIETDRFAVAAQFLVDGRRRHASLEALLRSERIGGDGARRTRSGLFVQRGLARRVDGVGGRRFPPGVARLVVLASAVQFRHRIVEAGRVDHERLVLRDFPELARVRVEWAAAHHERQEVASGIDCGFDLAAQPVAGLRAVGERRWRQQDNEVRAVLNVRARDAFVPVGGDIEKVEDDVIAEPLQMVEHRERPGPVSAVMADIQGPHGGLR